MTTSKKTEEPKTAPKTRQQRLQECGEEIQQVLAKHRCRIIPQLLEPEAVGKDGSRMIIGATYGLVADRDE